MFYKLLNLLVDFYLLLFGARLRIFSDLPDVETFKLEPTRVTSLVNKKFAGVAGNCENHTG